MPNNNINEELEFEQHIAGLNDRELIESVARQTYDLKKTCPVHSRRIEALESRTKKEMGVSGGIGVGIGAVIAGVIEWFIKRGTG